MAKVVINGKEYDTEKLPKEALDLINSVAFADSEIVRLQNQIRVMLAAKNYYLQQLDKILSSLESQEKVKF